METIVFIGTQKSGSSRDAIKACANMGFFTVVFTERLKQIEQRLEYEDVHLMEYCNLKNIYELQERIEKLQKKAFKIKAIVSFVDSHCYTACCLSEKFGLHYFTKDAIFTMENKILSRETLKETNYMPQFSIINPDVTYVEDDLKQFLPGVLKSPCSTGSKDVFKVNNYNDFITKKKKLNALHPNESLLIEEFIDGPQYLVEVLVIKGEIHFVAFIEQEISYLNNHFIVTGYYLRQQNVHIIETLKKAATDIIKLHKLKNGPCHLELRLKNDCFKLIEINPRISGGGMNKLIELGTGINLVKETLNLSLNRKSYLQKEVNKIVYMQYITVNKDGILEKTTGKNRTTKSKGVLSVYLKPRKGNTIHLPESMGHRYAYVIATGITKDEAINNAKNALKEIKFHLVKKTTNSN